MTLTHHELRTLNFLLRHFTEKYSINQLAKKLGLTPKGMHKLLKRLEKQEIFKPKKLGNAVFYEINFESDLAEKVVVLSLFEEIKHSYAKVQAKDLERLRKSAQAAVLFGSVLDKGEKAGDIDVMFVIKNKNYASFKNELNALQKLKPKPIHPTIQTVEDLIHNLKKNDEIMLEILKTGRILWGHEIIVRAVKNASR